MMFAACSNEEITSPNTGETAFADKAVGFDVYVAGATDTRAGYEGVMNTTRLQGVADGFGIFGYYTDQTNATPQVYPHTTGDGTTNDYIPNFMYNEHVTWNNTNKGWQYTPLKYWPNETQHDSQANPDAAIMDGTNSLLDQLTFFAYAPYVSSGSGAEGIRAITANTGVLTTVGSGAGARAKGDAAIEYKTAASVVNGVDLLWGVAAAGGQHYTGVNGENYGANEGLPFVNLAKPDVNTSLKFFFQHALARFGITVAAAIDQVPQGGEWPGDDATRITVKQVDLTGYFTNEGILNLNNPTPGVANWINMCGIDLAADSELGAVGSPLQKRTISITTDIADDIEDSGSGSQITAGKGGVTTAKQDLLVSNYTQVDDPTTFVAGDKYYTSAGVELYANITGNYYIKVGDNYNKATNSKEYPTTYYTLTATPVADKSTPAAEATYTLSGNNYVYAYAAGADISGEAADLYTLGTPAVASVTAANFTWPDVDYYKPERSFLMVVPTNNVPYICTTGVTSPEDLEALRTIWVTITYYVTTDDAKLSGGISRVENKIQKKVVLPSLDNGKSYNLHLLLGLTSVKVEAEVGDWKEVYVQTDLPQNTPGE